MSAPTTGQAPGSVFEFHVLGPLKVLKDGAELPMSANRELAILACLLLNANRVMSVERLVEAVWAGSAPSSAWRQIAICVSRLRRRLGAGVIETSSPGYLLRAPADSIDWLRFSAMVTRAREQAAHDQEGAVALLREALALWSGTPFEDLRGLRYDVARMAECRLEALETCLELEIGLGRHHQVIPELLALVAESPFRERVRAQLMLAQYRAGRRAEALRTYQETRRFLLEQIGLEPGPALRRLHEQILRDEAVLMRSPTPRPAPRPAPPALVVPCQLPPQVLPFVGRAAELAGLDTALRPDPETATPGAMVLSGAPGVGKTTLALRWAHARIDWFPDGQLFADLDGIEPHDGPDRLLRAHDGPDRLPRAHAAPDRFLRAHAVLDRFLRALGEQDLPADPAEKLALYRSRTARRRLLVVLDNVRDGDEVASLLPGGPGCRVVVTSADPLDELVARQGAHRAFLAPLEEDAARELADMLVGAAGPALGPQAVTDLVATSCGNPLSLRLGAARLRSRVAHA
ncbi:BTAD domain-containing putative transcriptional regulator [Nonomuraea sp. ZG12]|uniref:AfsR/SARP family transcriptional regulator n=1 Tax=Nonomuraea sp. ZG12 TaxID=3452207 RepID=UPI003F8AF643